MKKYLLIMILSSVVALSYGQEDNLFNWVNGNVVANPNYTFWGQRMDALAPSSFLYDYATYQVAAGNGQQYSVVLRGESPTATNGGVYDAFAIKDSQGNVIYQRWGNDPLWNVRHITQYTDNSYFLQVPLDNDSFALVFAGWLWDDSGLAGEMIIVVVKNNTATLVFDQPAFVVSYTPAPNFSMEYVMEVLGYYNHSDGQVHIPNEAFDSIFKMKVWKEGNLFKILF